MTRRGGKLRPATDAELDTLAEVSESDKERARIVAEQHGSAKLVAILNAKLLSKKAAPDSAPVAHLGSK
jgi:hypothetical protein